MNIEDLVIREQKKDHLRHRRHRLARLINETGTYSDRQMTQMQCDLIKMLSHVEGKLAALSTQTGGFVKVPTRR